MNHSITLSSFQPESNHSITSVLTTETQNSGNSLYSRDIHVIRFPSQKNNAECRYRTAISEGIIWSEREDLTLTRDARQSQIHEAIHMS